MWGVTVAVVVPCGCRGRGVIVAAFVLHAVLWLWEGEVCGKMERLGMSKRGADSV